MENFLAGAFDIYRSSQPGAVPMVRKELSHVTGKTAGQFAGRFVRVVGMRRWNYSPTTAQRLRDEAYGIRHQFLLTDWRSAAALALANLRPVVSSCRVSWGQQCSVGPTILEFVLAGSWSLNA